MTCNFVVILQGDFPALDELRTNGYYADYDPILRHFTKEPKLYVTQQTQRAVLMLVAGCRPVSGTYDSTFMPAINQWPDKYIRMFWKDHLSHHERWTLWNFLYHNGCPTSAASAIVLWQGGYDQSAIKQMLYLEEKALDPTHYINNTSKVIDLTSEDYIKPRRVYKKGGIIYTDEIEVAIPLGEESDNDPFVTPKNKGTKRGYPA